MNPTASLKPAVQGALCGVDALALEEQDPLGVDLRRCSRCGRVRHWCPRCKQGWIWRLRGPTLDDFNSCDECEATWPTAAALLASHLFGVDVSDPATFVVVGLVLSVVALLATAIPAVRATHLDPAVTLRAE